MSNKNMRVVAKERLPSKLSDDDVRAATLREMVSMPLKLEAVAKAAGCEGTAKEATGAV